MFPLFKPSRHVPPVVPECLLVSLKDCTLHPRSKSSHSDALCPGWSGWSFVHLDQHTPEGSHLLEAVLLQYVLSSTIFAVYPCVECNTYSWYRFCHVLICPRFCLFEQVRPNTSIP